MVTFESEEDSTAVLCGFIITNGLGNGNPENTGGGIFCENSSPNLFNIIVTNNSADNNGGGILCLYSSLSIKNSVIINNIASTNGGGICCSRSNVLLEQVSIENNSASNNGGGIFFYSFSDELVMINCQLDGNNCGDGGEYGRGGAMFISESSVSLTKCDFLNNSADYHAGAIYLNYASADINKCSFICNSSNGNVGGIYFYNSEHLFVNNCTFYNNTGLDSGAIRFYSGGEPNDIPIVLNTICWDNSPSEILFSEDGITVNLIVSYSDIDGGLDAIVTNNNANVIWMESNINEDPMFADLLNGDFHLSMNSPCIDAGSPISPLDPDGTIADMGAFYFDQGTEIYNNQLQITKTQITNYPNPFNPSTTIQFSLQNDSKVELSIFNIKGQKIKQLISDQLSAGRHLIVWDGADSNTKPVSSGIYMYKLKVDGKAIASKKCILLK